ncbi:MAG: hypothetical protein KF838_00335 [Phycisphaeraceae bacterium]|nr:MAG: hypothetical protein KF838_00335 [Phycisphaeraceae bacterium]
MLYEDKYSFDAVVERAYSKSGLPLDDLPYTDAFDLIYAEVTKSFPSKTEREVFHYLLTVRKAAELPRSGKPGSPAPHLEPDQKDALARAVVAEVGSVGARDQLPYTDKFDRVAASFKAATGIDLPRHDLWRAIANLSKTPLKP